MIAPLVILLLAWTPPGPAGLQNAPPAAGRGDSPGDVTGDLAGDPPGGQVGRGARDPERGNEDPGAEPDGDARMRALLAGIAARADREDRYIGDGQLSELRAELAELPDDDRFRRRLELLRQIGFHELRLGRTGDATGTYAQALAVAEGLGDKLSLDQVDDVRFELALAWLRHGETSNCVARHTARSCLLPIQADGVHTDQEGSRQALALLSELFERRPRDATAAWLANLAAMTVGEWPEAVPEPWRVPAAELESEVDFPRFPEVAGERGLASFDLSGGSLVDDLDGDGVLDVLTSTWDPRGGMHLFRGLGQGRFEEVTEAAGLTGLFGGLNLLQADYDDDGDVDVLVLRGAWLGRDGRVPNSLLRNDGGRFVDVTHEAGLAEPAYPTQTAAFADYDNDGDLDLYVGNESEQRFRAPCQLFQNQGDGTFVDVARELEVTNDGFTKGVAWGDVDADGWPDLFVSNMGGENRLYKNKQGSFKDATKRYRVQAPLHSFACAFFDQNDDGRLDLFVASYRPDMAGPAAALLGWPTTEPGPALFHQDAEGRFVHAGGAGGIDRPTVVMGSNVGDLDGDGRLDLYLGTGFPGYQALLPNLMYLNDGAGGYVDVTAAGGFGHLQKGHGVSFADLDGDGDVDLHEQMGGAFPGDAFGNALFLNPGFGNSWITVHLRGVRSNHFGVGARIRCLVTEDGAQRAIHRQVGSGGSFGASPITRTLIGLGRAEVVDELEVRWPAGETTQVFRDVPVGGAVLVVEGEDELRAP